MMQRSAAISAVFVLLVLTMICAPSRAQNTIPTSFELDPAVRTAMDAAWLTDDERQELRINHGVWEPADLDTPVHQARAALMTASYEAPSLTNPAVPATIRAEALVQRGDLQAALTLLADDDSLTAGRLRAAALEGLGRNDEALDAVNTVIGARNDVDDTAAHATEIVKAMIIRARLQGQPSRDFQDMLDELGRIRANLDRLYWPARLTEARLLADKHKINEAYAAAIETLHLNPRCAEAWLLLGQMSIERFDFDSCQNIITALHNINPSNPLAELLDIEYRLVRDDPDSALDTATQLLDRLPRFRPA
ncbi:MAG: hypothetical protein KC983_05645, partial [Phycisphaerales bacterium]|nr:hypothetical protein [Phycisphaerales bacterium]